MSTTETDLDEEHNKHVQQSIQALWQKFQAAKENTKLTNGDVEALRKEYRELYKANTLRSGNKPGDRQALSDPEGIPQDKLALLTIRLEELAKNLKVPLPPKPAEVIEILKDRKIQELFENYVAIAQIEIKLQHESPGKVSAKNQETIDALRKTKSELWEAIAKKASEINPAIDLAPAILNNEMEKQLTHLTRQAAESVQAFRPPVPLSHLTKKELQDQVLAFFKKVEEAKQDHEKLQHQDMLKFFREFAALKQAVKSRANDEKPRKFKLKKWFQQEQQHSNDVLLNEFNKVLERMAMSVWLKDPDWKQAHPSALYYQPKVKKKAPPPPASESQSKPPSVHPVEPAVERTKVPPPPPEVSSQKDAAPPQEAQVGPQHESARGAEIKAKDEAGELARNKNQKLSATTTAQITPPPLPVRFNTYPSPKASKHPDIRVNKTLTPSALPKPVLPSSTQPKKVEASPQQKVIQEQKIFLQQLNRLFKENRENIKTLESELENGKLHEKQKNISKHGKTKIKLLESQIKNLKEQQTELDDLIEKTNTLTKNDGTHDLSHYNLNVLFQDANLLTAQFVAKIEKLDSILEKLIKASDDYKESHRKEKTSSGTLLQGNTKQKREDAELRAKDLQEFREKLKSLKSQKTDLKPDGTVDKTDMTKLDDYIREFEIKLHSYFTKNTEASGLSLRGSAGKVNDMLKDAQTGLEDLYKITLKSLKRDSPTPNEVYRI